MPFCGGIGLKKKLKHLLRDSNFSFYFAFQSSFMDNQKYLQDLSDIRQMMSRSTQFISLSGLSGVMAGVYALAGAWIGHKLLENHESQYVTLESHTFKAMLLTALCVMVLAIATALVMTKINARKRGETIWNDTSKRLTVNFLIPLVTGGVFTLLLLKQEVYGLIAPATLIFYGLACVNASKYTFRDVRYIGLTMIVLGLLCTAIPGYSLEFWAFGFGVCHIVYGAIMHFNYQIKN